MLNLPEVGKPEGLTANAPGTALYFLDNDPRVGPHGLADVRNHRLGNVLAFKHLDCDEWHDDVSAEDLDLPRSSVDVEFTPVM